MMNSLQSETSRLTPQQPSIPSLTLTTLSRRKTPVRLNVFVFGLPRLWQTTFACSFISKAASQQNKRMINSVKWRRNTRVCDPRLIFPVKWFWNIRHQLTRFGWFPPCSDHNVVVVPPPPSSEQQIKEALTSSWPWTGGSAEEHNSLQVAKWYRPTNICSPKMHNESKVHIYLISLSLSLFGRRRGRPRRRGERRRRGLFWFFTKFHISQRCLRFKIFILYITPVSSDCVSL